MYDDSDLAWIIKPWLSAGLTNWPSYTSSWEIFGGLAVKVMNLQLDETGISYSASPTN